jgi:hypothetical protein
LGGRKGLEIELGEVEKFGFWVLVSFSLPPFPLFGRVFGVCIFWIICLWCVYVYDVDYLIMKS